MFEAFLEFWLLILAFCVGIAGIWLASWTFYDIRRCRRVIFYHIVQLICAGSAFALGLEHVLLYL